MLPAAHTVEPKRAADSERDQQRRPSPAGDQNRGRPEGADRPDNRQHDQAAYAREANDHGLKHSRKR